MSRSVTIIAGQYHVELPNGLSYDATHPTSTNGPTVYLSDEEGARLNPAAAGVVFVDNGTVVGPVRSVTIVAGQYNVELPNGISYNALHPTSTNGPTVYLSAEDGSRLNPADFSGVLVDNGWTNYTDTDAVSVQAAANSLGAVPTLTTADASTATATVVSITPVAEGGTGLDLQSADWTTLFTTINDLVADVASIRTEFNKAVTDLTAVQAWLVAEYTALTVSGGPQA